jgi:E-phenylitaconyl-CoA hydratase
MAAVEYKKTEKIAYITINRPDSMNALGAEVNRGLADAYIKVKEDDDVWVAIITGAGDKAFSAGDDIKEFHAYTGDVPSRGEPVRPDIIWKPFIAAIHGYCMGGGLELALACDIRIAAENAQFALPEVNIGSVAAFGGPVRLPRLIPSAIAAEMLLTGKRIDAQEAYRIGLVSRIVPREQLMSTAGEIAETIISRAPLCVRATKEIMVSAQNMSLEDGLRRNKELAIYIATTDDFIEGASAFTQKRPPRFTAK